MGVTVRSLWSDALLRVLMTRGPDRSTGPADPARARRRLASASLASSRVSDSVSR